MPESTLKEFPKVPLPGTITAAEYGAQLISLPSSPDNPVNGDHFTEKLDTYRKITADNSCSIFKETIRPIPSASGAGTFIIRRRDDGVIKGMWDACRDAGFQGLQEYLRQVQKNPAVNILYGCLTALSSITDVAYRLKNEAWIALFPHLGMDVESVICDAVQVRNWHKSWVRAVAWHPTYPKFALALRDDSVRICEVDNDRIPLLRCAAQKNVTCLSWRPYVDGELAVGVEGGIIIWELEKGNKLKPAVSHSRLLTRKNHAPVTSVQYSTSGLFFISSSSFDLSVYIWDATTSTYSALRRLGGGGVPFALWSPADDRILATSPSSLFRIWEREHMWAPKRWNTAQHPIEAACWTPDSSTLLFASGEMIYCIHFMANPIEKFINQNNPLTVPIFDVSTCTVPSEDDKLEYKVGGRVRKMQMDPSGTRLAICFDDSQLIAIFRVQPRSLYYLAPCGFIRGFPDEYPLTIAFQQDYMDGALLTIVWNSGRIQYFPFLFAGASIRKNILHEEYQKVPSSLTPSAKAKQSTYRSQDKTGEKTPDEKNDDKEKEDEVAPSPNASFRAGSFVDAPVTENEYVATNRAPTAPPRLFSLELRSPGRTHTPQ